jgi:hypothetical protein
VYARLQAPPRSLGPLLIAVTRRERLVSAVTAVTRRQRRDRAVTAVTGVIAVSAVIAGFVLLGPVRAAPHGGQESRASRDLRAGRDRRDPSDYHARTVGVGPLPRQ